MLYLTEIAIPQNLEQLTALKQSIESGNVQVTDIEAVNTAINMLSNLPTWAYIGIGIVGVICIINALKKSIKTAAMLCIVFGSVSSSGIASNIAVNSYTAKALDILNSTSIEEIRQTGKEAINNGKSLLDKGEKAIQNGKDIIDKGERAIQNGKDIIDKGEKAVNDSKTTLEKLAGK